MRLRAVANNHPRSAAEPGSRWPARRHARTSTSCTTSSACVRSLVNRRANENSGGAIWSYSARMKYSLSSFRAQCPTGICSKLQDTAQAILQLAESSPGTSTERLQRLPTGGLDLRYLASARFLDHVGQQEMGARLLPGPHRGGRRHAVGPS